MKDKDNIDSENRTELIASRVSKTEKEVIEKFIEEYNEKNDTNLNKTEFIRTAIFTHMYHLENSDYILDVDFFDKSINVIEYGALVFIVQFIKRSPVSFFGFGD